MVKMGKEEREKRREQKRQVELEQERIFEEKIWKGHESKKCPECGLTLVVKTFITKGFGSTVGEFFVTNGPLSLFIFVIHTSIRILFSVH